MGENMVKVVTSDGGIMELYTPITVDFITSEFPGHAIFYSSREFFSSSSEPLLHNEELRAGEVYYLLPLNNNINNNYPPPPASRYYSSGVVVTSASSSKKSTITRQVSSASSSSSTPCRTFNTTGGVWKVRLVISPEQLSEILSKESLTEALIESLRMVAKCANGGGAPNNISAHFNCTCTLPHQKELLVTN